MEELATESVLVNVPDGASPGDVITLTDGGRDYSIRVPERWEPGVKLRVNLADAPTQDGPKFNAKVPKGIRPGDKIKVAKGKHTYSVEVPNGKRPGDKFEVKLQDPNQVDFGQTASDLLAARKFSVRVPADGTTKAGDTLAVTYADRRFSVVIPQGAQRGQLFTVTIPPAIDKPNASNPAGRVQFQSPGVSIDPAHLSAPSLVTLTCCTPSCRGSLQLCVTSLAALLRSLGGGAVPSIRSGRRRRGFCCAKSNTIKSWPENSARVSPLD